jgi:hypothetical protein
VKAQFCEICGDWFEPIEPTGDLANCCECCYDERISVENAIECASESWTKINLNSFIAEALTVKEIEDILAAHILTHKSDFVRKAKDYCFKYSEDFKLFLAEKYSRFEEND